MNARLPFTYVTVVLLYSPLNHSSFLHIPTDIPSAVPLLNICDHSAMERCDSLLALFACDSPVHVLMDGCSTERAMMTGGLFGLPTFSTFTTYRHCVYLSFIAACDTPF